jgi:hypothetical protein
VQAEEETEIEAIFRTMSLRCCASASATVSASVSLSTSVTVSISATAIAEPRSHGPLGSSRNSRMRFLSRQVPSHAARSYGPLSLLSLFYLFFCFFVCGCVRVPPLMPCCSVRLPLSAERTVPYAVHDTLGPHPLAPRHAPLQEAPEAPRPHHQARPCPRRLHIQGRCLCFYYTFFSAHCVCVSLSVCVNVCAALACDL